MEKQQQIKKDVSSVSSHHRLSVVVPLYNEEDNITPLLNQIHASLADYRSPWELILVDDGSTDNTVRRIRSESAQYGAHVRLVELQRNFGQTAAMQAGIDTARGDIIATLDGDLQNDPRDIPAMVQRLFDEDLDMVAGWRQNRKDNLWRKIPSWIANRIIRRVTHVHLHDYGCTLKVSRSRVLKKVRLYGEMHRFIPAWFATQTSPARIKEQIVRHYPRRHGSSKYGMSRTFRVIIDLLSVFFFLRYKARPGHYFGAIGLIVGTAGALILFYLVLVKLVLGEDIGTRPLLLVGVLMVVMSAQFITTGVLSEMLARTYFESGDHSPYVVRNTEEVADGNTQGWAHPERS